MTSLRDEQYIVKLKESQEGIDRGTERTLLKNQFNEPKDQAEAFTQRHQTQSFTSILSKAHITPIWYELILEQGEKCPSSFSKSRITTRPPHTQSTSKNERKKNL